MHAIQHRFPSRAQLKTGILPPNICDVEGLRRAASRASAVLRRGQGLATLIMLVLILD
jgi:hypothetical protein